jgi:integrase
VDRFGRVRDAALSDRGVARIVQRAAAAAGLDPTTVAGHSLRAGFATTAARKGKGLDAIMRQTLHRSERVARTYIRHGGVFEDNAAVGLV